MSLWRRLERGCPSGGRCGGRDGHGDLRGTADSLRWVQVVAPREGQRSGRSPSQGSTIGRACRTRRVAYRSPSRLTEGRHMGRIPTLTIALLVATSTHAQQAKPRGETSFSPVDQKEPFPAVV